MEKKKKKYSYRFNMVVNDLSLLARVKQMAHNEDLTLAALTRRLWRKVVSGRIRV